MPSIEVSADGRTVALQTEASTYAVRLDHDNGTVLPIHWGEPIAVDLLAGVPAWTAPHHDSFAGRLDGAEEFPIETGARFGPPALGLLDPQPATPLRFRIAGHRIADRELVVTLADPGGPLAVDLHYRSRPGSDVIERWSVVRHTGDADDVVLHSHAAAAWCVPPRDSYRLSHVAGHWSREAQVHRTPLAVAETVLTSRQGLTGHHTNPWVMLDDGAADEDTGPVWSMALAASGSWWITTSRTPEGRCSVLGGSGHGGLSTTVRPGETVVSPVFAGAYTSGGFGAASRAWHDYQRRHVLPHGDELRPILYNSWEATSFAVDEQGQLALAERAARLGAELFVVDDGWFGARTSDRAGLGDWTPNPERFPHGLAPLAAKVRHLGMEFGLWVEPEMVNADSDLYRAHPDWILHRPGPAPTELRDQLVLDLTRPDVRAWALGWLDRLVRETGATFLKWDCNRPITEGRPHSWTGQAHGVYEVLDRLRAAHPRLRVESCAGGGGRVDLGVMARTDQFWTSDNTDAVDRLAIQHGHTQLYAPGGMVCWVTDSPNPLTGRRVPLRFRFHVAMAGVLGIGGNLAAWTDAEMAEAAELVDAYRAIRPVVQHGALHRLRPAAGHRAWQYHHGDDLVVIAWRPAADFAPPVARVRLRGLRATDRYRDLSTGVTHAAAVLTGDGLPLPLPPGEYASVVVHLRRHEG
ncbi:alpha-galactosidase [Actinoplanes sp. CA-030573]|uniref:alpha-galactosidase n=1 Tax=Actinoplanes sp. CA-030573 TaxID=3239898 RepID=UPI003D9020A1